MKIAVSILATALIVSTFWIAKAVIPLELERERLEAAACIGDPS